MPKFFYKIVKENGHVSELSSENPFSTDDIRGIIGGNYCCVCFNPDIKIPPPWQHMAVRMERKGKVNKVYIRHHGPVIFMRKVEDDGQV